MVIYILIFVVFTIPLLFLLCVLLGRIVGAYVGQQIGSLCFQHSRYPSIHQVRYHMVWGSWIGTWCGWVLATIMILAFYFFGSIHTIFHG